MIAIDSRNCPICGYPEGACVCEDIDEFFEIENLKRCCPIRVSVRSRRRKHGRIKSTRITLWLLGQSMKDKILQILERECNCGGKCRGPMIILQGDQRLRVSEILPHIFPGVTVR